MKYKVTGIVTAIGEVKKTRQGAPIQQIHLEQLGGRMMYPALMGDIIDTLDDILPGDLVEIQFHIKGSKGVYNNVYVDDIKNLTQ